jgi:hypothetical protein
MSWTISQVKNGGWRTDARFVEVAAYDGAVVERDALQARLDEAVELLRRYLCDLDSFSETQRQIDQAAHAFLTLHTPKGGK